MPNYENKRIYNFGNSKDTHKKFLAKENPEVIVSQSGLDLLKKQVLSFLRENENKIMWDILAKKTPSDDEIKLMELWLKEKTNKYFE